MVSTNVCVVVCDAPILQGFNINPIDTGRPIHVKDIPKFFPFVVSKEPDVRSEINVEMKVLGDNFALGENPTQLLGMLWD